LLKITIWRVHIFSHIPQQDSMAIYNHLLLINVDSYVVL
jgi:hypothetical protein